MDAALVTLIQVVYVIASLALFSVGLAVIFGMMRVMNLAHGEFLMLGAYAVLVPASWGVNIWICMFLIAPVFVGLVGVVIERLIIRHLYGRMMDTLLATWGLSLFIIGLMTTLFGNTMEGISTPLGSYSIGEVSDSSYKFLVIAVALAILVVAYLVLKRTKFGLVARGTMENAAQASVMGVNPKRVYTITFGVGAALSGLAGAVLAPISGVLPSMGAAYIGKAFIVVIGGGEAIVTGTATAATLFGAVNQATTYAYSAVVGEVALLLTAIVMLRILPQGITGRFFRRSI